MKKSLSFILLAIALGSCVLHPKYRRPPTPMSCNWRLPVDEGSQLANVRFWQQFDDPILDSLICAALKHNEDLKAAIARVQQFVAKLGIAESALYPQIAGTGIYSRQEVSALVTPVVPGTSRVSNNYDVLFNASYQVDIWGQIYSSTEVALANLLAQVEVRRTVVLTLVSAVADAYFNLRQFDKQLQISNETLKSRQESLRLAVIRYELGLTSELQVKQAESEVQIALADIKQFEISVAIQEDLISFLIGQPSQAICRGLPIDRLHMPLRVPAGLPSELLCQRPDILAAEQRLVAANAQIGVARAELFPSLSLTGVYGFESTSLNNLFSNPAKTWLYGATLMQEIFTGGRITNDINLAFAQKCEMLHLYESTVLNALRETNDALISHRLSNELVQVQTVRVKVVTDYFKLATLRYDNGQTDYLTVLDAERELFRAQLDLASAQGQSFTTLVEIYQALGGGWVLDADGIALQPPPPRKHPCKPTPKDDYFRFREFCF